MKKALLLYTFFLSLLCTPNANAYSDSSNVDVHVWTNLGYSPVDDIFGQISATASWHVNPWIDLLCGLRYSTTSLTAATAKTSIKFPMGKGCLLIENTYLWNCYYHNNIQEFNSMVTIGYRTPRFCIQIGTFNKFFTNIHTPYRNRDYVFEPLNLAYNAEVLLFKPTRKWNFGIKLTNIEELSIIRFHNPITIYNLYYNLNPNCQFELGIRNHHSGIFDLTYSVYEVALILGTKVSW